MTTFNPRVARCVDCSRLGAWFDRFGVHHQYELDALATLRPRVLEQWLEHEIAPHYDRSLGRRLNDAVLEYEEREQAHLNEALALDPELRDRVDAAVPPILWSNSTVF